MATDTTKRLVAKGKKAKRFCPMCGKHTPTLIVESGAWEIWTCKAGHTQRFKVKYGA